MQDTVESAFPDTVVVTSRTAGVGDAEGNETFTTSTDTYDGQLVHVSASEAGDTAETQVEQWFVRLPHDATIDADDKVTVGDLNFEVDGGPIYTTSPGQSTHLHVPLRLV